MTDPRRYTDKEFALVLRKALELEDRGPTARDGDAGLTLEQMQAVAREVGVDPELVARAALMLPAEERSAASGVLGGPTRASATYRSQRSLGEEDVSRVVSAIRTALATQGAVERELDAVTWKSQGDTTQLFVTLRPHADGTEVQLHMDRGVAAFVTWFFPVVGFLFVAGALGNSLAPESVLGGLLYFLAFLVGGVASARTLWWGTSLKAEARLRALLEVVAREVDATPARTGDAIIPLDSGSASPQ